MNRKLVAWTLAGCGLLCAGLPHAAPSADLSVKGKLQPGACSVAVGNSGVFDLGNIKSTDLNRPDEVNVRWPAPGMPLSIDCKTPTKVALRLHDNRSGTHFNGSLDTSGSPKSTEVFGLGMSGGRKIGEYLVSLAPNHGDGKSLELLKGKLGSSWLWEPVGYATRWSNTSDFSISFTDRGGTAPNAFRTIDTSLAVLVYINKSSELDLSQEIKIDGSATLELIYL